MASSEGLYNRNISVSFLFFEGAGDYGKPGLTWRLQPPFCLLILCGHPMDVRGSGEDLWHCVHLCRVTRKLTVNPMICTLLPEV